MFHLFTGREEGKKVKKGKFVMENPLEAPVPHREAAARFTAVLCDTQSSEQDGLSLSQRSPTRAVSSNCNMFIQFTFPAPHFCLLAPTRDTTQSRLFWFLRSKAGGSIKSPCNSQELRNSVIRADKPVGNEGPWSEGVSYIPYMKLHHKAPS